MMIRSSKNLSSDLEWFVLEEMRGKRKRRMNNVKAGKRWKDYGIKTGGSIYSKKNGGTLNTVARNKQKVMTESGGHGFAKYP